MKIKTMFVVLVILAVIASGCAGAIPGGEQSATPTREPNAPVSSDMTPQPTVDPTPIQGQVVRRPAMVNEIEIMILESFPVQVRVVARGILPDACTEIGEIRTEREDNTFNVTITTIRPADQMCAEMIREFEESISLDVRGLEAGEYTVKVNDVTDTFTLAVDNVLPEEER